MPRRRKSPSPPAAPDGAQAGPASGSLETIEPAELLPADPTALEPLEEAAPPPVTGDSLRYYLRQIARYPRLTREEEHELAVAYRKYGDTRAAYRLVTGNLRLVVRIAHDYRRAFLNLLDLVQEGNVGLMHAVRKYDPLRGVPFSAYAAWWIRAYIIKHLLDHWSIVKVGTTNARRRLFFNLKKEKERLEREGVSVGPRLLAERFETSEQDVIDVGRALSLRDLSLDAPVAEESDRRVWETLPIGGSPPDESAAQSELREMLRGKLDEFATRLKERELYVFRHRLVAEDPVTLQAIGDQFGITREAARLIEKKVIANLRDFLRAELKDLRLFEVADEEGHVPESPAAVDYRLGKKKR